MKATILTIGDEILIGQIVDTNSVSIAKHLNAAGIVVREKNLDRRRPRADHRRAVERALHVGGDDRHGRPGPHEGRHHQKDARRTVPQRHALRRTGGRARRADARRTRHRLQRANRSQAMVPACCTVLFNAYGTAPGMWFERDGHVVVSLPGRTLRNGAPDAGRGDAASEGPFRPAADRSPHDDYGRTARVDARRADRGVGKRPASLPEAGLPAQPRGRAAAAVGLRSRRRRGGPRNRAAVRSPPPHHPPATSSATRRPRCRELVHGSSPGAASPSPRPSCTGGTIASRFTAMPGASAYFLCGVVSYSNEAKTKLLGVDPDAIARHGAVSEEVARQMAEGARRTASADYAVATTGIAGPAEARPKSPSARSGSPWPRPPEPLRSAGSAAPTGDRSSTAPRPSPSRCCATA